MNVKHILIIASIMLLLDLSFLYLNKNMFDEQVLKIQDMPIKLNYVAAGLCYVSMVLGLYYFIIRTKKPVLDAAILGFVIFSVYELTNMSLLDKWDIKTVIVDSIWGSVLFGLTTYLFYYVAANNTHDFSSIHPASI